MRPEFRTQQLSHHRITDHPEFTEPPGAYKEPSDSIVDDTSELSSSSVNARRSRRGPGNSENTSFFVGTETVKTRAGASPCTALPVLL
jgi:hypothetical protein